MKKITVLFALMFILLAGCKKENEPKTYKIYEYFNLKCYKSAYVIDTTVLPTKKYTIKFEEMVSETRPNKEDCSLSDPGEVDIKLSIKEESGNVVTRLAYFAGCLVGNGTPNGLYTTKIDAFGVSLRCMKVSPHPSLGTTLKAEDYNADLTLWK